MKSKKEITHAGGLFIFISLVVSVVSANEYFKSKQSKTWQVVKGIIMVSEIETSPYGKLFGYPKHTFTAKIKYSYMVNGKKYLGDKVRFGLIETDDREVAVNIKNKYTVGSIADVYYNPKKTSQSVLEPFMDLSLNLNLPLPVLILVAGPVFFIFGMIILIYKKRLIE